MKNSKLMTLALAGIVMCGFGITTAQATFTLVDDNSTAEIDISSQLGMFNWTTDGVDNLFQQWFWYRIGDNTTASSIDTLTLVSSGLSDVQNDGDFETLFVEYSGAGFTIEITWSLDGGSIGSNLADIGEQISITSTGAAINDFHFFQYSDFDLNGEIPNDTVSLVNANTWTQTNPNGLQLSETVSTPPGTRWEADTFSNTRTRLNNVIGYDLNNFAGPLGPADVTWAWQWDFNLGAGGSFQISKDKNMRLIPAPGAVLLAVMGMGMIGRIRRRNA